MRYWSRVTKEEKSALRGEWENAINGKQSDSVQQETLADSVTEKHRKTGAVADKRDNRPLLRQKRGHRLTDKSSKGSGLREKRSSGIKGPRGCTNLLRGKCTNPSCFFFFSHPPVCQNHKAESGCKCGDYCQFGRTEVDGQPSEKSKNSGGTGSVGSMKESIQLGCVSRDYPPRKCILREVGQSGPNHTVKFSKGTWHHIKIRERKGLSRGVVHEPFERNPCAPKFEESTQDETLRQERCGRREAYREVIVLLHPIDPRRLVLRKDRYAE